MAFVEVIKYEGDNTTFIWKHPCEDFNTLSQLIVHESQEAIFMLNGQAMDTFGAGRYTLETENIPLLTRALNLITGRDKPFHAEVYFINKAIQMGLKWGTDSKVRYIDPETGVPLQLGASGEMSMQVADSRKLLIKLVGTTHGIAWDSSDSNFTKSIQTSFRPVISNAVKSNLTPAIKEAGIDILEIDEHLEELSKILHKRVLPGFEEFGITIPQFFLTTVVLPEDDPNFRRIRELHTIAFQQRVIKAEAEVKTTQTEADRDVRIAQAEADADVNISKRRAELERQTTETEVKKREAERTVIEAQAEAAKLKAQGLAEAEVMRAKGYSEKDVINADVQKAYAEGLGQFGSNAGSGGGGSAMSDIMGLGIGLQAAGALGGQIKNIFSDMDPNQQSTQNISDNISESHSEIISCPACGESVQKNAKFCPNCGEKIEIIPEGMIKCPQCGKIVAKGKFCLECGYKFIASCPNCGAEIPTGAKFCLECGQKL